MSKPGAQGASVLAIGNQKGGVAKTTNCVHIAAALGSLGRSCLVWDLDPNHGATLQLGADGARHVGSYEVLMGIEDAPTTVLRSSDSGVDLPRGVDLIAASDGLARLSRPVDGRGGPPRPRDLLGEALGALRRDYDYILLDTAPDMTVPTAAAYLEADRLILSTTPEPLALVGVKHALMHMQAGADRGVAALLGVVLSRVEGGLLSRGRKFDQRLVAYARKSLRTADATPLTFETTIARCVEIQEGQMLGRTLFQMNPKHRVASQYRSLAREIEDRIKERS
ncbi:ParA family protein [Candidatus Poribacteria bacterium]|jgi:chromosome partitioning protein|nr:ParA family protein [Candidatus Poribacteria bacterium]MBT5532006.1 ParA family protein [Candidatus Poribacteria bacterium]MBT5710468.1 ParA family protein [Candidatus Poribacteria bacterium]MBT7100990.1 ParA family protein [Candidatus Poribacteria bacterium]MBT7804944.1 ParA family protein [Candidatus Poribacteria bacterium]